MMKSECLHRSDSRHGSDGEDIADLPQDGFVGDLVESEGRDGLFVRLERVRIVRARPFERLTRRQARAPLVLSLQLA